MLISISKVKWGVGRLAATTLFYWQWLFSLRLWFGVYTLLLLTLAPAAAEDVNPGRAPTGEIANVGDLLKEPDGLEFRFGYLPSCDRLRLLVLRPPKQSLTWEITLRTAGKGDVLARHKGNLPMPEPGETVSVPPLADGTYELTLALVAGDGKRRELKRTFERKHFPWENTSLGRDRVVIPPFAPLVIDEKHSTVSCVLRKHDLDGTGLWKQVASEDRPLLSAPMRLEVESGGKTHVATGRTIAFSEQAADRVQGKAERWTAGPVQGSTEFEFDYDGLMKVTLHLQPTADRVDAMQLVIPMKTGETWLMHPVTDLLRFHYAGRIPNGQGKLWDMAGNLKEVRYTETGVPDANGKVWDSRHVGRYELPEPFVPYIWLGGPERGICWFAENDRDWSVDPKRPMMEIRRQGETTSLIIRLVTKPLRLARPRTIVFGLMATPAKPMPETPVSFRRWLPGWIGTATANVVRWRILGATYYWGGSNSCSSSFYPAYKNFSIYDEFVRVRRGGKIDPKFVDKWLSQFRPDDLRVALPASDAGGPLLPTFRNHVNYTLQFFSGNWRQPAELRQTDYAIPYLNGRGMPWGDETRTFLDEWSEYDVADPRWPGQERFLREKNGGYRLATFGNRIFPLCDLMGIAYAAEPVPSRQDMILFYAKRMLDTFADGIYFDDYCLMPNYSPFGPGYVGDDGKLHAGVNIFGFHDLTKRVAVMQHQMGRRPSVYLHMTNTNIVPILSFGTMILDHEWRDAGAMSKRDSQERLYLDDDTSLLLTESTGLQSGCLAVYHDLFWGDERLSRSALGVALTHEMKFARDWWPPNEKIGELLSDFGYGLPDCRVWRYWDGVQPVKATGAPVKMLVLARGGKAMVVVASYGPTGKVQLDLDAKTLGLSDRAVAVNAETGERFYCVAPGQFILTMPRHDFRLIRIEP